MKPDILREGHVRLQTASSTKDRFAVLRRERLEFFKTQEAYSEGQETNASVELKDISKATCLNEVGEAGSQPKELMLELSDQEIYLLASGDELARWARSLRIAGVKVAEEPEIVLHEGPMDVVKKSGSAPMYFVLTASELQYWPSAEARQAEEERVGDVPLENIVSFKVQEDVFVIGISGQKKALQLQTASPEDLETWLETFSGQLEEELGDAFELQPAKESSTRRSEVRPTPSRNSEVRPTPTGNTEVGELVGDDAGSKEAPDSTPAPGEPEGEAPEVPGPAADQPDDSKPLGSDQVESRSRSGSASSRRGKSPAQSAKGEQDQAEADGERRRTQRENDQQKKPAEQKQSAQAAGQDKQQSAAGETNRGSKMRFSPRERDSAQAAGRSGRDAAGGGKARSTDSKSDSKSPDARSGEAPGKSRQDAAGGGRARSADDKSRDASPREAADAAPGGSEDIRCEGPLLIREIGGEACYGVLSGTSFVLLQSKGGRPISCTRASDVTDLDVRHCVIKIRRKIGSVDVVVPNGSAVTPATWAEALTAWRRDAAKAKTKPVSEELSPAVCRKLQEVLGMCGGSGKGQGVQGTPNRAKFLVVCESSALLADMFGIEADVKAGIQAMRTVFNANGLGLGTLSIEELKAFFVQWSRYLSAAAPTSGEASPRAASLRVAPAHSDMNRAKSFRKETMERLSTAKERRPSATVWHFEVSRTPWGGRPERGPKWIVHSAPNGTTALAAIHGPGQALALRFSKLSDAGTVAGKVCGDSPKRSSSQQLRRKKSPLREPTSQKITGDGDADRQCRPDSAACPWQKITNCTPRWTENKLSRAAMIKTESVEVSSCIQSEEKAKRSEKSAAAKRCEKSAKNSISRARSASVPTGKITESGGARSVSRPKFGSAQGRDGASKVTSIARCDRDSVMKAVHAGTMDKMMPLGFVKDGSKGVKADLAGVWKRR